MKIKQLTELQKRVFNDGLRTKKENKLCRFSKPPLVASQNP